jgi:hypothetical protein
MEVKSWLLPEGVGAGEAFFFSAVPLSTAFTSSFSSLCLKEAYMNVKMWVQQGPFKKLITFSHIILQ